MEVRSIVGADPDAARALLRIGETSPDATLDSMEFAAFTLIANTLLNLDEVVTKN